MEHPAIEVRLLGSFEVRVRGEAAYVPRGRPRALLASLALAAGRVLSVEHLTERMWGEEPPLRSRNAVQNNIRRLRQVLGAEAILTAADGYLLPADPDDVDALRFTRLVERAADADPETARPLLVEALRLWHGEPLVGAGYGSLEHDQVPRLTECYLSAVEQRVDIDLNAEVAGIGLASAQAAGDSLGAYEAALILGAGLSQARRGAEARRSLHTALAAATTLQDPAKESSVLSALGIDSYRAGDYAAATDYHQRAVAAARRGSRDRQLANALFNFGYTQIEAGDATPGIRHTTEALELYRQLGAANGEAWCLGNLAEAYQKAGQNDTALEYGEPAVGAIRTLGDKIGVAEVLLTVGRARRALGERDLARAAWHEARELLPEVHPLVGEVTALLAELETPAS